MKPVRPITACAVMAFALLLPSPGFAVELVDCLRSDGDRTTRCQLQLAGIYHALTTAQARYALARPSCQFPPGLEHAALTERLDADLREILSYSGDQPMNAVVTFALFDSSKCKKGVATEPDGYKAAGVLHQCQAGLKDESQQRLCSAYLRGLYEGLSQFSGFEGSRAFTCPPEDGRSIKDVFGLFIDEVIRDPSLQTRPAAEVLAMAMTRAFPCGRKR